MFPLVQLAVEGTVMNVAAEHYVQDAYKSKWLTFNHDHIDVDGADGRLGETLAFLQDPGYLAGWDPVVRFGPKRHQLPHGHAWGAEGSW